MNIEQEVYFSVTSEEDSEDEKLKTDSPESSPTMKNKTGLSKSGKNTMKSMNHLEVF